MTRLNDKIARLNAFKNIVSLIETDIKNTTDYAEQCMKNHHEEPENPYYAQWALENQAEAKAMESALREIIELAVSK